MPEPILLCYDGSVPARAAIEAAGRLFPGHPALVTHVWQPVAPHLSAHLPTEEENPLGVASDVLDEIDRSAERRAVELADEGVRLAGEHGLTAEALVIAVERRAFEGTSGEIADTLIAAAEERGAVAVVLGSRGRGMARLLALGSVAFGVAQRSSRPVTLIPAPE